MACRHTSPRLVVPRKHGTPTRRRRASIESTSPQSSAATSTPRPCLPGSLPTSRVARGATPTSYSSGRAIRQPTYAASDPAHMITLGDEGFGPPGATSYPYQTGEGVDFVKNLGVKDLDFGVFHFYPGSCTQSSMLTRKSEAEVLTANVYRERS